VVNALPRLDHTSPPKNGFAAARTAGEMSTTGGRPRANAAESANGSPSRSSAPVPLAAVTTSLGLGSARRKRAASASGPGVPAPKRSGMMLANVLPDGVGIVYRYGEGGRMAVCGRPGGVHSSSRRPRRRRRCQSSATPPMMRMPRSAPRTPPRMAVVFEDECEMAAPSPPCPEALSVLGRVVWTTVVALVVSLVVTRYDVIVPEGSVSVATGSEIVMTLVNDETIVRIDGNGPLPSFEMPEDTPIKGNAAELDVGAGSTLLAEDPGAVGTEALADGVDVGVEAIAGEVEAPVTSLTSPDLTP